MDSLPKLCQFIQDCPRSELKVLLDGKIAETFDPKLEVSASIEEGDGEVRITFSSNRTKKRQDTALNRVINGLVIAHPSGKVCCATNMGMFLGEDDSFIDKYNDIKKIYFMDDGTTAYLYYYDGRWCMASNRSYDISNVARLSPLTFREALDETLQNYADFSFEKLNKNYVYAIGFHHKAIHPFSGEKENHAWFLQAFDIANNTCQVANIAGQDIGLPEQKKFAITSNPNKGYMMKMNANALNRFINEGSIHYGFVIVNSNGTRTIWPSSLYKSIRSIMYHNISYNVTAEDGSVDYTKLSKVIVVQALNKPSQNMHFPKLFQSYKPLYDECVSKVHEIAAIVHQSFQYDNMDEFYDRLLRVPNVKRTVVVARAISKAIAPKLDLNKSKNEESIKTILDIMASQPFEKLYIECL